MNEAELLRRYLHEGSQDAFAELVRHHAGLVYSALRLLREPSVAEVVTQNVFCTPAENAQSIRDPRVLAAWLHRTSRQIPWTSVIQRCVAARSSQSFQYVVGAILCSAASAGLITELVSDSAILYNEGIAHFSNCCSPTTLTSNVDGLVTPVSSTGTTLSGAFVNAAIHANCDLLSIMGSET